MIIALIILATILASSTIILAYFVNRLSNAVFELEEQVEESLDIIDNCYSNITEISRHPVVSDEPIVKQLLGEIRDCRYSLLLIANKLISISPGDDDGKEED